jgi:hypothetical protein
MDHGGSHPYCTRTMHAVIGLDALVTAHSVGFNCLMDVIRCERELTSLRIKDKEEEEESGRVLHGVRLTRSLMERAEGRETDRDRMRFERC